VDYDALRAAMSALDGGQSMRQAAALVGVAVPTISRWRKRVQEGSLVLHPTEAQREFGVEAPSGVEAVPEGFPALSDAPPVVVPAPSDTHAAPLADVTSGSVMAELRAGIARLGRVAAEAEALRQHSTAQRALRDQAALLNTLARLERTAVEAGEAITVTKEDLVLARERWAEIMRALAAAPVVCQHCGRALRLAAAESQPEPGAARK
jgi:transposase-like protein